MQITFQAHSQFELKILQFLSAEDTSNQQVLSANNTIPAATLVALTVLNSGSTPVYSTVKLKHPISNQKLTLLIGPKQTEKFYFKTLGECTLGDFELKVAKPVKEAFSLPEKEIIARADEGSEKYSLKRKIEQSNFTDSKKEVSSQEAPHKKAKIDAASGILSCSPIHLSLGLWDIEKNENIEWGQKAPPEGEIGLRIKNTTESEIRVTSRVCRSDETPIPIKGKEFTSLHKDEEVQLYTFVPKEEDESLHMTFLCHKLPIQGKVMLYHARTVVPIGRIESVNPEDASAKE